MVDIFGEIITVFRDLINTYGVLGIFLISFFGNTIPYSTIPYLFFIIVYSAHITDPVTHILITIAGGAGAALGKLVVYYIGRSARVILSEEMRRNTELFAKIAHKSIFIAVFLFAALPLPDDILYVPLGVIGYNVIKYFIALILGKIIITGLAVFFGTSFSIYFRETILLPPHVYIPLLVAITLVITYIVMKIDWQKVTEVGSSQGFIGAVKTVIIETVKVLKDLLHFFKRIKRSSDG